MSNKTTTSKDKGKRVQEIDNSTTQSYKMRFLKPIIRPSMFKLSLPITPDELPNRTPYLDLVVPDGRNNPCRCFWTQLQSGKIALTRGWEEFYQMYKINLDFMLYFTHKGNSTFQVRIFDFGGIENSYQLRDPEEPPYIRTGNYEIAKCINIPPSASARAVAAKVKSKWPFFVMDLTARMMSSRLLPNVPHLSHFTGQRHPLILTHGHIQVEATYTRYSGKRDGSFGVISGGWENFASLCNFKPGGVGVFEVISTEPVTIIQIVFGKQCSFQVLLGFHGVAVAVRMLETAVTCEATQ
ncbi:hypothetical protein Ahy_A07g031804 [Arachis hypogaea]|uniref:TF-B3 domain-containing protein n=1 Tax=Arachis hypogaea TaxID=3818 RepID=A0A445C503_ARAHY|nr:hypothetical protein Ahy_A07g031804 [Arachis hypogaea]